MARPYNPVTVEHGPSFLALAGIAQWIIECITILATIFVIVDGALPQAQMAVLNGRVVISSFATNAISMAMIVLVIFIFGRFRSTYLTSTTLILLFYLFLQGFFLAENERLMLREILDSHNSYMLPLLMAATADSFNVRLPRRRILILVLGIAVPCLIFSFLQYTLQRPILPTQSVNGNFVVVSGELGGELRAFSLFSSAFTAGVFYCFLLAIAGAGLFTRWRVVAIGMAVVIAAACYATLTRLVLVGMVACFVSGIAIQALRERWWKVWIPIFTSVAGALILLEAAIATTRIAGNNLGDTRSLVERFTEWQFVWFRIQQMTISEKLLGVGTISYNNLLTPDSPRNIATMPIDNAYLLIILHIGFIGLALLCAFYWAVWLRLLEAAKNKSVLTTACAAFWAVIPIFAIFNDPPRLWSAVFLIGVFSGPALVDEPDPKDAERIASARLGVGQNMRVNQSLSPAPSDYHA